MTTRTVEFEFSTDESENRCTMTLTERKSYFFKKTCGFSPSSFCALSRWCDNMPKMRRHRGPQWE